MSNSKITIQFDNMSQFKAFLENPQTLRLNQLQIGDGQPPTIGEVLDIVGGARKAPAPPPPVHNILNVHNTRPADVKSALIHNLVSLKEAGKGPIRASKLIQMSLAQCGLRATERNVNNASNMLARLAKMNTIYRPKKGQYALDNDANVTETVTVSATPKKQAKKKTSVKKRSASATTKK